MPAVSIYGERPTNAGCVIPLDRIKAKVLGGIGLSFTQIIDKIAFMSDTFYMIKEMNFVGKMSGSSAVSPALYVRLLWIEENPGQTFDKTNNGHVLQLIDLYLTIGQDFREDPMIKNCMTIPNFLNLEELNKYTVTFIATHD